MSPDRQISDIERDADFTFAAAARDLAGLAKTAARRFAPDPIHRHAMLRERPPLRVGAGPAETVHASNSGSSDAALMRSALVAIEESTHGLSGKVEPTVRNGWLILDGEVEGPLERQAAEEAVKRLRGIRGFSNNIQIASEAMAHRVSRKIELALIRKAPPNARRITVTACDHRVILCGYVPSEAERYDAEAAAWGVRGVAEVVNRIRTKS